MATPIQGNIPSPEQVFENPGNSPEGTPAQFDMGQNPDGTFRGVGESVGSWRPNADPSVVNFEDLQHASARIVRDPERTPGGDGLEALSGADLLEELRGAINDFNGVGSERETMSRLSRFNPFRHEDDKHSAADVRRAAERLDAVQGEMSTRLEAILRGKEQRNGSPYFDDAAVETALTAHKLFGSFTVARLRKESLESQAERSNSRGILGRVSNFLVRRVVDIDQRVENKDISKMGGRLRKLGYFGITALPLGVAGIAAAPVIGLGAGAAAVGAGMFAAGRVGRGLFSAKIQNTADSITRAEQSQIARVNQQMNEDGSGITSAFVEGGEASVKRANRRLAIAAGSTAAFGALGYFAGNFIGNIGRDIGSGIGNVGGDLKDNGVFHYMGEGVDDATDFGDDFLGGDGKDGGSTGGSTSGHEADSAGGGGNGDVPTDPTGPDSDVSTEGSSDSILDKATEAISDGSDALSSAYQEIKEKGLLQYLTEGVDTAHQFGDDVLNGTGTEHLPNGDDVHPGSGSGNRGGTDIIGDGSNGPTDQAPREMSEMHQRQATADSLVDAHTGEKISVGSLNVKPGGGFISTFQEEYGLNSQQANELYYRVESHLRGMEGTYAGPGDVRISAPGELKLSGDARQAIHDELIKMGVAEDKQVKMGIGDAQAVPGATADSANTGGIEANPKVSGEAVRNAIDGYLDPERLQDEESWTYIENVMTGIENPAVSPEKISSYNDQLTARIDILHGLQADLDALQARENTAADLSSYQDRLNLHVERMENVQAILEEVLRRSQEVNDGK